jgi:hypothetical protein
MIELLNLTHITHLDAPTREEFGDPCRGAHLLKSDFRMGMKVVAPALQQRQLATQLIKSVHRDPVVFARSEPVGF